MATDKLINSSQGDSIISLLGGGSGATSIADSLATIAAKSNTPYNTDNKLNTQYTTLTDYAKASAAQAIASSDNVPTALGKLEYKVDTNTGDINTNKNNILSSFNANGQKNIINPLANPSGVVSGVTYTKNSDGSIRVQSNGTNEQAIILFGTQSSFSLKSGTTYVASGITGGSASTYDLRINADSTNYIMYDGSTEFTYNGGAIYSFSIVVRANQTLDKTFYPMICEKPLYDVSPTYQPYALSNTTLTSGLNSYIENGVRNFAKYNHNMPSWSGVTINVSDDAISVSGTSSSAYTGFICASSDLNLLTEEPFVVKIIGTYSGFSIITQIKDTSGTRLYWDLSLDRIIPSGYTIEGVYLQRQSATSSVVSGNFNILITPKAIYDLGVKDYEPYALSNAELTAKEQINENNILSLYNQNGKTFNVIDWSNFGGNSDVGIKYSYADDTITAVGTKLTNDSYLSISNVSSVIKSNTWYALVCTITGSPRISARIFGYNGSTYTQLSDSSSLAYFNSGNYQSYICRIVIAGSSGDSVNATIKPMLIEKSIYDAGFTNYQPYALPNTAITPVLQECVDNGVKNLVNVPDITISASGGGYVTANNNVVLPAGKYVIIANATATSGNLLTSFKDSGGNTIGSLELAMNGGQIKGTITLFAQSSYFNAFANQPTTVTKYMIITEAMYKAGFTDYQPYAMSNADLTSKALRKQTILSTNDDFDTVTSFGMYKFNGGPANNPAASPGAYGILLVFTFDNYIMQLCYDFVNGVYYRNKVSSWSAWTKFN